MWSNIVEFEPDVIVVAELKVQAAAKFLEANDYMLIVPKTDEPRKWGKRVCEVHVFVRKGLRAESLEFGERWHTVRVGNTRVCGVHLRHKIHEGKLSQYPAMLASL